MMERAKGVEAWNATLAGLCSTPELRPRTDAAATTGLPRQGAHHTKPRRVCKRGRGGGGAHMRAVSPHPPIAYAMGVIAWRSPRSRKGRGERMTGRLVVAGAAGADRGTRGRGLSHRRREVYPDE